MYVDSSFSFIDISTSWHVQFSNQLCILAKFHVTSLEKQENKLLNYSFLRTEPNLVCGATSTGEENLKGKEIFPVRPLRGSKI